MGDIPDSKVRSVWVIRPVTETTTPSCATLVTLTMSPGLAPKTNGHSVGLEEASTVIAESLSLGAANVVAR